MMSSMEGIQVISTITVQAANHNSIQTIELSPWDLRLLLFDPIQKGLLFHHSPKPNTDTLTNHLRQSLSKTLNFFPPLAGRLTAVEHDDDTSSFSIVCNNLGALFVHSFFPLNGVKNFQGTSNPLLAVQLTELVDGIFIGCTINHAVVDGKSFWHFFNSWSEISRGFNQISKPLISLERWFSDGTNRPIRIPSTKGNRHQSVSLNTQLDGEESLFHFTKENIANLKAKANQEAVSNENITISSLQAVLSHVWRSIIRNRTDLDSQQEIKYKLVMDLRQRQRPKLADNYFGNAVVGDNVTMKVNELLDAGGLGKAAGELNKMVSSYTKEKIETYLEKWLKNPGAVLHSSAAGDALVTIGSPRFDIYGNDFGWGKPVAALSGAGNNSPGTIAPFGGAEEGSIDVEVSLPRGILEAMGKDPEFIDFVSKGRWELHLTFCP